LVQPGCPTVDGAPNEVAVAGLQLARAEHAAGGDAVTEAGRAALDPLLDALSHGLEVGRVPRATDLAQPGTVSARVTSNLLRHMGVRPEGFVTLGHAGGVGDTHLADQQERLLRDEPGRHLSTGERQRVE
jgi:hypothetical protein